MELQKYNGRVNDLPELIKLAELFAASGMFTDAREKGQALVKIQAGAELGIPPFQAMCGVHIIKGKPAIGSGLIAAKIKASGKYTFKVLTHNEKVCKIEFYEMINGSFQPIGISEMTIDQARKQGSQNLDRLPLNMLFARAISNGVRWHCPDVFMGSVYTPDELGAKVNEDETIIETTYEDVKPEPIALTVEQIADKINLMVPMFEKIGLPADELLACIGKLWEEIIESDLVILRELYKDLKSAPERKEQTVTKYKEIFNF